MRIRFILSILIAIVFFVGSKTLSYAQVSELTPNATFAVAYNVCPLTDNSSGIDSLPFVLPLLLIGMGAGIYIGKKQKIQTILKPA